MTDILRDRLGQNLQESEGVRRLLGRVKGVGAFFADAIEALKDTDAVKAVAAAAPWWTGAVAGAFAEAVPPVKFAVELLEKGTKEEDPYILGLLACTLAYERSVEEALTAAGVPKEAKKASREIKDELQADDPAEGTGFRPLSFAKALQHPFVVKADALFEKYLAAVGYSVQQRAQIRGHAGRRFVANLKTILSHGKTKEKFEPFTTLMELGTDEEIAYDAILTHVEYQRWQFEDAPVFKKEPFALKDIYIDTECGVLKWGEIQDRNQKGDSPGRAKEQDRIDPFVEQSGGRHDLVQTVLEKLRDPNFHEAIVIQGTAGSGKSSFTLKLCTVLAKEGLYPIRVRLRDVALDRAFWEALPKALFPPDFEMPERLRGRGVDDPFRGGAAFNEEVSFGSGKICPYVLILDGWDEISISANEGFKFRVEKMLEEVRNEFLKRRGAPVRVILTGRPSIEVSESSFLRRETLFLTIKKIRPDQLRTFVDAFRESAAQRRIETGSDGSTDWTIPEPEVFKPVFERYEREFAEDQSKEGDSAEGTGSVAVLGLPLLAHLAIRLISQWKGDRAALVANPTTLYRGMVDLTCEGGGKPYEDSEELEGRARVSGRRLRKLLHGTAAAMTVRGVESISYEELSRRLSMADDALNDAATELMSEHEFTALMISFFFRGGQKHLGCEFLHKSFREYLFAEAIVEALKDYGRQKKNPAQQRTPYWKDFDDDDPRRGFSRRLSELLAPQWLRREIGAHLDQLLAWEIGRLSKKEDWDHSGSLPAVTLEEWENARDGLADLWDWWGEGVHLRPQPVMDKRTRAVTLERSYAEELVEFDLPFDPIERAQGIAPSRTTTMDSHLGDGLFHLCAVVHYTIALETGWMKDRERGSGLDPGELWEGVSERRKGPRRYQSGVPRAAKSWTLFTPSGEDRRFFKNYISRINAAAWRPEWPFPAFANLSGTNLAEVDLMNVILLGTRLENTNLMEANLESANLMHANLRFAYLSCARMSRADLIFADLTSADLRDADLADVEWGLAMLDGAKIDAKWGVKQKKEPQ